MIKIDIISGFLGAGKTTLIKRLLNTKLKDEKVVLIENEYGEIGIDGSFLKDTKIDITELNQGCICCSLQGDFEKALKELVAKYNPDRIIIEPSGVGKLSDIVKAVTDSNISDSQINALVCMCDVTKAKMYLKNFGEFYIDQIKHAKTIILSRTDVASEKKISEALDIIRGINDEAIIVTTPTSELSDEKLIESYEAKNDEFERKLLEEVKNKVSHHHHHHHDEEHDHEHCEHDHDHEDDDHDEHEHEHEHHHHHCSDPNCSCHHEGDLDADDVFVSYGFETVKAFDKEKLNEVLDTLANSNRFGIVLRSKGIVKSNDNWFEFDLVPGEFEIRETSAIPTGKICVIGSNLKEEEIKELFLNN